MKRIIIGLLILILVVSSGISSFAFDKDALEKDIGIKIDVEDLPEINKYLEDERYKDLNNGTRVTYNISLPVLRFNQKDSDWKDDIMETEGLSIGSWGCALTSTAMVFKYYGASTDPGVLNDDLGDYACLLDWDAADDLGSQGHALLSVYDSSPTASEVQNTCILALQDGYPVIIGFKMYNNPNDTHFVLVKSVIGSGEYWTNYGVNDPNGGQITTLQYFLNQGYQFNRMVVYQN
jgi:hypothetical protein